MAGDEDQLGVVIAPGSAEEAGRCLSTLRAAGFHPTVDYSAAADRQGVFPVLVPAAELGEAKGFLRGLRAAQPNAAEPSLALAPAAAIARAGRSPQTWAGGQVLPRPGQAVALLTGLLAMAGAVAGLVSMLHFLSSLRDH